MFPILLVRASAAAARRSSTLSHIYLPDISHPEPEHPVQVPFLPDFWDSKPKQLHPQTTDPPLPKLVIIAAEDTHHGGGPSHNLHDEHREIGRRIDSHVVPPNLVSVSDTTSTAQTTGLLQDIAQDIGIPPSLSPRDAKRAISDLLAQPRESYAGKSRDLDKDESRGIWVLLGLLAGSWIAGGVLNKAPPKSKPYTDNHQ